MPSPTGPDLMAVRMDGVDAVTNSQSVRSRLTGVVLALIVLSSGAAWTTQAAEVPHHHLALFVGAGTEVREGHEDERGYAVGLVYEFRFHHHWGIGAAFEVLGQDTFRDNIVAIPVSLHLGEEWRLFAGPGLEFLEEENKALIRIGVGYEIHLGGHWGMAPEAVVDIAEGGNKTWLVGLAFGYEF